MNTSQTYSGNTGSTAADCNALPFEPGFINVPVGLAINGRNADNHGASQVDVLISALAAYKDQVTDWQTAADRESVLLLIDELKESVLDAMYNRLSETSAILHRQKHLLPDPAERSSR